MTPDSTARCARHPDRPSLVTCGRCGAFACDACRFDARCTTCVRTELAATPGFERSARWAMRGAWGGAALTGLVGLGASSSGSGSALVPLVVLANLVLVALVLAWQAATLRRAAVLGRAGGLSVGRATTMWLVPGLNLLGPPLVFRRWAKAAGVPALPMINGWWGLWLFALVVVVAGRDAESPDRVFGFAGGLFAMGDAFLAMLIVAFTHAQQAAEARLDTPR